MKNNNNRKIIVAALAFFLALSIGYAVFSETITIEGTATAQLEGGLEFECASGIISETGIDSDSWFATISDGNTKLPRREEGYSGDSCSITGDKITVKANLAYPLAGRAFTIKMTNNATYPIKLNEQEMGISGYDDMEVSSWGYNLCKSYETDASTCMLFNYADGNGYNGISEIPAGGTHYITIILYWHGEDDVNDGLERTATFTLDVPFEQAE